MTTHCKRLWAHRFCLAGSMLVLGVSCQAVRPSADARRATPSERPNVIVIVVDDLRWDELGISGHPYLETPHIDRLALGGALFTQAFHTVPLCSPNRATILTGQYPSRHGIIDNVSRARASHRLDIFPRALQAAGYETGFFGKWHMGNDPSPRPGFDRWVAIPGQGRSIDPELYEDGAIRLVPGYLTDILTDRAVHFIREDRDRPFFLYLGHKAIHPDAQQADDGSSPPTADMDYIPAPRHEGRYAGRTFPLRENAVDSIAELTGKPALQRALIDKLNFPGEPTLPSQLRIQRRAEMLLAVDDSTGRLVEALAESGKLENTAILFTSDNGYWYGEHHLTIERRLPYEEGIRTPMLLHYPRLVEPGTRIDELVATVDLAPTILELAQATIGDHIQGRSTVPLLVGDETDWRDSILIEFYTYENPFPWLLDMDYRALRTERYKYIHWMQHPTENELYDLRADPFERRNLAHQTGMQEVVADLQQQLGEAALHASGLATGSPRSR